jgi:hypothetical protein
MDQERRTATHAASPDRDAQRCPLIVVRLGRSRERGRAGAAGVIGVMREAPFIPTFSP